MEITEEALQAALSRVVEPDLKKDIVTLDLVQEIVIDENTINIIVEVSNPAMHSRKRMEEAVIFQLKQAFGDGVKVHVSVRPISGARGGLRKVLPFVKHIVAVASGKGGVGKSTITANLAVASLAIDPSNGDVLYAGTGEEDLAELATLTIDEMKRAATDLSETEIARARTQMKAGLLMGLESPSSRAERLARLLAIWDRVPDLEETIQKIDAVDLPSIRAYAEKLVTEARVSMALYGPVAGAPSLEALRERLVA